jgi:hypothetical protein
MAIVKCFKHWRHYLKGSCYTIEVWSNHQNLQGFMRQPRINGRQARWLVYLTPYDFIIRHRPGLLNPADGPSRRPDYKARRTPDLVQKDLLASKLVVPDSKVLKATRSIPKARRTPDLVQKVRLASKLVVPDSKVPEATRSIPVPLCDIAKCQLYEIARMAEPSLHNVARRGPVRHGVARNSPDIRLCNTARSKPANAKARPNDFILPEAELCKAAKATRRVNALSPVGTEPAGQ